MASLVLWNSACHLVQRPPPILPVLRHPPSSFSLHFCRREARGVSVVTRAGPPSASAYIFAFILPLSLIGITIFSSIRIADKLDKDFLEEMEINRAIMEAEEEDGDMDMLVEEKPSAPRTRNRPKKEAETSSI